MWTIPSFSELQGTLEDPSSPIGKRMRAAYYCKQMFGDDNNKLQEDIVDLLCTQVMNMDHGSLMRHEFAYVLGQMQTPKACKTLEELLQQTNDCVMVRHEAAEALGSIADPSSKYVLEIPYPESELSETCHLALYRINHPEQADVVGCACMLPSFNSIDPAAPDPEHVDLSDEELGCILRDASLDLVPRYRAMFSLRNRRAVQELNRVLLEDKSSPLLRHEVAFVLGQLQSPDSIEALQECLERLKEHVMVRHEAAEALGAIDVTNSEQWNRIEAILKKYQLDDVPAVAESCIVALDAADYWGHSNTTTTTAEEEDEMGGETLAAAPTFGQQKNLHEDTPSESMRREMLAQHFNVQSTAA